MENVNQFIEQILKENGVVAPDEHIHKQLVSDLSNRLIDFINRRLIEAMKDEDVEEFIKLLDEKPVDPVKVQQFVDAKVPDKEKITLNAMLEFRALYIGESAQK